IEDGGVGESGSRPDDGSLVRGHLGPYGWRHTQIDEPGVVADNSSIARVLLTAEHDHPVVSAIGHGAGVSDRDRSGGTAPPRCTGERELAHIRDADSK